MKLMELPLTRIDTEALAWYAWPFSEQSHPLKCFTVVCTTPMRLLFLCSLLGEGGGRGRDNAYVLPRVLKLQGEGIAPSPPYQ
jgi:hypothetical protein